MGEPKRQDYATDAAYLEAWAQWERERRTGIWYYEVTENLSRVWAEAIASAGKRSPTPPDTKSPPHRTR